jgi:hypothetical protein
MRKSWEERPQVHGGTYHVLATAHVDEESFLIAGQLVALHTVEHELLMADGEEGNIFTSLVQLLRGEVQGVTGLINAHLQGGRSRAQEDMGGRSLDDGRSCQLAEMPRSCNGCCNFPQQRAGPGLGTTIGGQASVWLPQEFPECHIFLLQPGELDLKLSVGSLLLLLQLLCSQQRTMCRSGRYGVDGCEPWLTLGNVSRARRHPPCSSERAWPID